HHAGQARQGSPGRRGGLLRRTPAASADTATVQRRERSVMGAPTAYETNTVLPFAPDRLARLPLHAELFLVAHDDDTGRPHINEQSLAIGLAGAILLELWFARRVEIGWTLDIAARRWVPQPGRIAVVNDGPVFEPLFDAALAAI